MGERRRCRVQGTDDEPIADLPGACAPEAPGADLARACAREVETEPETTTQQEAARLIARLTAAARVALTQPVRPVPASPALTRVRPQWPRLLGLVVTGLVAVAGAS